MFLERKPFFSSCWFSHQKCTFEKIAKKTFYKSRKTCSSRSEDDEKKLVFQNKIFSSRSTCEKQFWQSRQKVYVRKPIVFHSMFQNDRNNLSTKTFSDSKLLLAVESPVLKFPPKTVHQNFCADGRKVIKIFFSNQNFCLKLSFVHVECSFGKIAWDILLKSRNFFCSISENKKKVQEKFLITCSKKLWHGVETCSPKRPKKLILYSFFKVYVFLKKIVRTRWKETWQPCQKSIPKRWFSSLIVSQWSEIFLEYRTSYLKLPFQQG